MFVQPKEETPGIASARLTAVPLEHQGHLQGAWWGSEKGRPWAGPLLLRWIGLLGCKELVQLSSTAGRQICPGTAPVHCHGERGEGRGAKGL